MYKDHRYINAGENEFYRWGRKAIEMVEECMIPNEAGFYSIPANCGKYWTFGTSKGKYGEFARVGETCFSVNKGGFMYAKAGTEKGEKFVEALKSLVDAMKKRHEESFNDEEEE